VSTEKEDEKGQKKQEGTGEREKTLKNGTRT